MISATGCVECSRGFCDECDICVETEDKCHMQPVAVFKQRIGEVGRPLKNPEDMIDPSSTGRKRAAQLYPLYKEEPCEWRGKKNCGGGKHPIVGCEGGYQRHRHHGPVKETTRNEPGNVHRICNTCHNRWHALNDPVYDHSEFDVSTHAPVAAEPGDFLVNEAWWKLDSNKRKIVEVNHVQN